MSQSTSEESKLQKSRSAIASDVNNDGKLDLIVKNTDDVNVYENTSNNTHNWIKIKQLERPQTQMQLAPPLLLKQVQKTVPAGNFSTGYLSQPPYIKHFGLGNNTPLSIKVIWPNKTDSTIKSQNQMTVDNN